ncbi:MAG TPA: DoxX family protein [Phycisphaerales bacterium]|nr:DoxX family protein [Phycisphaerales bacterium]HMP36000.1 DoxX family protein [Phycisphaerales bacterium]
MRASQFLGLQVMPFFARALLAAIFIPMGWNKFFTIDEFHGDDAARLRQIGVGGGANEGGERSGGPGLTSATIAPGGWSLLATAPPGGAGAATAPRRAPADEDAAADDVPAPPPVRAAPGTSPPTDAEAPATPPAATPAPEVVVAPAPASLEARRLHHITLLIDRYGFRSPSVWAHLAAATELVGGALLLIGLFSRIWGLGLAATMAVAFWTTSYPAIAALPPTTALFDLAQPPYDTINRIAAQLGLGLLALLVAFAGPGGLSLDRLLFRRSEPDDR